VVRQGSRGGGALLRLGVPDSRIDRGTTLPADTPSGPAGSVKIVELTLLGQPFAAFSAGPFDPFNHAVSFMVTCDSQAEIDGLSWQTAPTVLGEMINDPDRAKARRAAEAMLKMVKLDIAKLERAYQG
jgi:predicted 3-demethylubiquinone-9 3-methyltransferase (glyoxalase superfamily)